MWSYNFECLSFDEIVGQESQLKLLKLLDIPFNIVLTGPHGCGKTVSIKCLLQKWNVLKDDLLWIDGSDSQYQKNTNHLKTSDVLDVEIINNNAMDKKVKTFLSVKTKNQQIIVLDNMNHISKSTQFLSLIHI